MRIVLTGGGSGGHVTPLEPIIAALRTQFQEQKDRLPRRVDPDRLELWFIGVASPSVRTLFEQWDVPTIFVPSGKLRRYTSALTIIDMLVWLPLGIVIALGWLWRFMPDVIVSKGGYGSLPVVIAAAFYRIPVLLHESDAVPGLANRKLARLAAAITVGIPAARQHLRPWSYKTFVTGTPVRGQLDVVSPGQAKRSFGWPETETVLLVMGGSQGAKQVNEILLATLPSLIVDAAIIHLTGSAHFAAVSTVARELLANSSRRNYYKPFPYLTDDRMAQALAAADVVVSRAGATALAELAHLRKPSLLIPLASAAQDHQRANAQSFEAAGAALVLDPNNVGKNLFEQNVRRLLSDSNLRQTMQTRLAELDRPQAARDIARLAFRLAVGLAPIKAPLIKVP